MISDLNWLALQHCRKFTRLTLLFKLLHQHLTIPDYYLLSPSRTHPLEVKTTQNYQSRTNITTHNSAIVLQRGVTLQSFVLPPGRDCGQE